MTTRCTDLEAAHVVRPSTEEEWWGTERRVGPWDRWLQGWEGPERKEA